MKNIRITDNGKFSITFILSGTYLASFIPFLLPYFTYLGYSTSQSGLFLMLYNLCVIISLPLIGYLNDNHLSIRKSLIGLTLISAIISIVYMQFTPTYTIVFLYILMLSFFQKPVFGLLETYLTKMSYAFDHIDFGLPRSFSSLGYACTTLFMGTLIEMYGYNIALYSQIIFMLLSCFAIYHLRPYVLPKKEDVVPEITEELPKNNFKQATLDLVRNKNYILLVVMAAFVNVTFVGISSYIPSYITAVGGDNTNLGVALFIMAISEIPILVFYKKINRYISAELLILISIVVNFFKMMIPSIIHSLPAIYFSQSLQAFSFALFIPSLYSALYKSVKPENASYGMTIAITLYASIFGTLSVYLSGVALDHISIFRLLNIYAVSTVIAFIIMVIKLTINKKERVL
ncbi:MAG: MFS transporter [Lachnospirales bacterium]